MNKYKVIIAEDEALILKNLAVMVERECPEFEVISKVMTGQDAIESINNYQPHLLIADIRMPKGSGLDILKYIHENNLNILSVVISSFSQFNYAQHALQYGARDYLLKPVSPVQLKRSLSKIKYYLDPKTSLLAPFSLDHILAGRNALPASHHFFQLFLIYYGNFEFSHNSNVKTPKNFDLNKQLRAIIDDLLLDEEKVWIGNIHRNRYCYGLLGYTKKQRPEIFFRKLYDSLNNDLSPSYPPAANDAGKKNISVLAKEVNQHENIEEFANDLMDRMRHKCIFGKSIFLTDGFNPSGTSVQGLYNENIMHGEKLSEALQSRNIVLVKLVLNDMIYYWRNKDCPTETIMSIIKYQYLSASKNVKAILQLDWENYFDNIFSISSSWEELYDRLLEIFLGLSVSEQENIYKAEGMMKLIDEYICNHYSEHISNMTLSKIFGFVPSYISKLFKEYKGSSPVEYLTKIRIKKAIELIKNIKDVNVYDISKAVGFSDPSYFTRLFKQQTGMLPTDYRDRHVDKKCI